MTFVSCGRQNQPPSCVAVLDPLGSYHNKQAILRHLRSFLQFEWESTQVAAAAAAAETLSDSTDTHDGKKAAARRRALAASTYHADRVALVHVKAPQQQNSYDCGVFVLKFATVILENYLLHQLMFEAAGPISKETVDGKLVDLLSPDAFAAEQIADTRGLIKDAIARDTKRFHAAVELQRQQKDEQKAAESKDEAEGDSASDAKDIDSADNVEAGAEPERMEVDLEA